MSYMYVQLYRLGNIISTNERSVLCFNALKISFNASSVLKFKILAKHN